MKTHKLEILPGDQVATVQVSSFADLLEQRKLKIYVLKDMLDINHRTAQRRIQKPETMTIKELLSLAEGLSIPAPQLLELIRDEFQSRPPEADDPAAPAELAE
jgi:hypothetical protein